MFSFLTGVSSLLEVPSLPGSASLSAFFSVLFLAPIHSISSSPTESGGFSLLRYHFVNCLRDYTEEVEIQCLNSISHLFTAVRVN